MNVWPATLPQRMDVDGYQESLGDGRLRSQSDAGPAKVRRRFSAVPRPLSVSTELTSAQLATFKTFVVTTLAGGTLPFQMPAQSGTGTWIVQFAQTMPGWTAIPGGRWRLSLDLVILP